MHNNNHELCPLNQLPLSTTWNSTLTEKQRSSLLTTFCMCPKSQYCKICHESPIHTYYLSQEDRPILTIQLCQSCTNKLREGFDKVVKEIKG